MSFQTTIAPERNDQVLLGDEEITSLDLDEFCIYRPVKIRTNRKQRNNIEEMPTSGEMVELHDMGGQNNNLFFFDGIISYGQTRRYVQKIPFEILSIGGYEDTRLHTVGDSLWIQSRLGKNFDVWYCLKTPAVQYRRFYKPFLWIADFAKHLVDYMHNHKQVRLVDLRSSFQKWLNDMHGAEERFRHWLGERGGNADFRSVAAAYATFLLNQAFQLDAIYAEHPLWNDIHPLTLNSIPLQVGHSENEGRDSDEFKGSAHQHKTVVTPYVYEAFKHLPFAKCFEVVHDRRNKAKKNISLNNESSTSIPTSHNKPPNDQNRVHIGDVVAVRSDAETKWKGDDKMWYGYVQGITQTEIGQKLDLLWLYRPSDTPCQGMRYPHLKELFLSDHCNCGDGPIYAHEVVSKPRVAFFKGPDFRETDFFVRQRYVEGESAWVTLKKIDFRCDCSVKALGREYKIGDTLLVARAISSTEQVLEPVVLLEKAPKESTGLFRVGLLQRLGKVVGKDIHIEPNELVYTSVVEDIPIASVHRPCHIRFYTKEEKAQGNIPAPYCRQGTADCFFITSQLSSDDENCPKSLTRPWPLCFNQGWDPAAAPCQPKLRGLDIFCGGGNLGRGLEEGGAVEFEWAVDYFKEAIHTYGANLKGSSNTRLFYGSVNDFLRQAMEGRGGKLVAQAGEIEVISAGSPCQGFSSANQRKGSSQSLLNVSMVASVLSYVDFYRPQYAFLENVLGMAKCGVNGKEENVFAQVICGLVGMGYQVRPSCLDAWSFGSPQSRTRLFISITAPGLTPLPDPPQTHAHPDGSPGRSLGKTANGLPLGSRYWGLTPFKYVTIGEATKDLPKMDGKTTCIPFPDHRVTRQLSIVNQVKVSCIPRFPRGMSFVKAARRGLMPPPQMEGFNNANKIRTSEMSRSWQRVNPEALVSTVTTCCQPEDGISGSWVHWNEDRTISVMEVRRAQGFPDREVIVGSPAKQWKIIGNSVARPVALALGMSLRAAWLANNSSAPPQSALEGVIPQVAPKLGPIANAFEITKAHPNESKTTPKSSNSLNRTPSRSPSLPVRTPGKRLISWQTLETRPEPPGKKRKLHTSTSNSLTLPQETITISSDSETDIETLSNSTAHTSLSTTREATSSGTDGTKTTFTHTKSRMMYESRMMQE
jgi:DNA (cytosine-5)-methyltransferase 1